MPKLWLFDLDDTLFEASGGMLHKIHLLMNEYMCRELGMEWEEASALRRHYWSVYGATFLGLWRHHGIDPRDFLSFAHDFDPRLYIQFSGCPAEDVKRLPGRKVATMPGPCLKRWSLTMLWTAWWPALTCMRWANGVRSRVA